MNTLKVGVRSLSVNQIWAGVSKLGYGTLGGLQGGPLKTSEKNCANYLLLYNSFLKQYKINNTIIYRGYGIKQFLKYFLKSFKNNPWKIPKIKLIEKQEI